MEMPSLVTTLAGGMLVMVVGFVALRRLAGVAAPPAAALLGVIVIGAYLVRALPHSPEPDVIAIHLAVYGMTAYGLYLIYGVKARGASAGDGPVRRLHWGPLAILAFFGVIFLVNGIMLSVASYGLPPALGARILPEPATVDSAYSAFPGTVARDFHKKEALYNAYLEQVAEQRARGWQVRKGWQEAPRAGEPAVFLLSMSDRHGAPIEGAAVTGEFMRPSDSRMDQPFAMRERKPGLYEARLVLPAAGAWDLLLEVRRGPDLHEVRARTSVAAERRVTGKALTHHAKR
jgi:nitrogen fixation protein FixH